MLLLLIVVVVVVDILLLGKNWLCKLWGSEVESVEELYGFIEQHVRTSFVELEELGV